MLLPQDVGLVRGPPLGGAPHGEAQLPLHRLACRRRCHQGRGGERAQVLAPLVERAGVGRRRDLEVGRPHVVRAGGSNSHWFCKKEDLEPPLPSDSMSL